ncbi:hypothetical protein C0J52_23654 [Blattella germanica]|nr:hypothetical protein C0J52_23654 [Blattella germanica]
MNNNFKMNGKPQMIFPSPYQRSNTTSMGGRIMPSSIPSGSHMGSNMRPTVPKTPLRREFEDNPEPMGASMAAMSFDTETNFNFMGFPASTSPSFRFSSNMPSMTSNLQFRPEFPTYADFQTFSPMSASMDDYDNSMMESVAFGMDEPSRMPEMKNRLMKNNPSTSTFQAKKSEQKVRFQLSEKTFGSAKNTTFVAVGTSEPRYRQANTLLLRDNNTPVLQCIFYDIDRPLPLFQKGQLVRCVGKLERKNKLRAFSVRTATAAEKSGLQRVSFICQRTVAAMEMGTPEP